MSSRPFTTLLLALACLSAVGCASTVKVTSDPSGALVRVRGSGRASYRWKSVGLTPCEFETPYSAVNACVQWKDGSVSEVVRLPIPVFGEPEPLHFRKQP